MIFQPSCLGARVIQYTFGLVCLGELILYLRNNISISLRTLDDTVRHVSRSIDNVSVFELLTVPISWTPYVHVGLTTALQVMILAISFRVTSTFVCISVRVVYFQ